MVDEKTTEKATKVKKKKWIKIIAPKSFNNEIAGEIPLTEPKSLIGKMISLNLMTLIHDMKKQNTSLKLIVTDVQGDKAITDLHGYNLSASSVRRLVRKGKERIDMSFVCKTADNKNVRIKPLMIPPVKIKGSVSVNLKKVTKAYFMNAISKITFENVIKDLIMGKLHKAWKDELKKTYPIRVVEIAAFNIEKEGKAKKEEIPLEESTKEQEEDDFVEEKKEPKHEEAKEEPVQAEEGITEEAGGDPEETIKEE